MISDRSQRFEDSDSDLRRTAEQSDKVAGKERKCLPKGFEAGEAMENRNRVAKGIEMQIKVQMNHYKTIDKLSFEIQNRFAT